MGSNICLSLEDRVAIVTGAATGIGRACALLFVQAGADVLLADIRGPELEEAAEVLRQAGGKVATVTADLAEPAACKEVVETAVRAFGRLDILVNNAGVGTVVIGGTVESIPLELWDLALDVNVRAMYLLSQAAIPHMRDAGRGSIINVASGQAYRASRTRPTHAYCASKGAVLALTRSMAVSFGKDRIRVNAINPGAIRTRLTADTIDALQQAAEAGTGVPIGRVGEPEDIANAALFLASDLASFVTGAEMVVDGGAMVLSR
jgi:NAD(P)-dependent dehydrogenase (short-subunit alcohol dehydrogenase family)